ncbi:MULTISPECIES: hypothetical protein [unclassified Rhizobium]|uniref:hypothetical protein n=1 Tax=unclassified Rhizobium TaxID=2613769 RepID=UPI001FF026F1|nr:MULTISPECIES: hypothetical protein [unclassified Rhizobium]
MITASSSSRFTVGPDRSGRWIVHDREGLVGGRFINEAAALHFAASECNCRLADIHRAAAGIVLEFMPFARGAAHIH